MLSAKPQEEEVLLQDERHTIPITQRAMSTIFFMDTFFKI